MVKKFYCKMCNDGIARTRKGIRDHLRKYHLRNEYFGGKEKRDSTKERRIRMEEFK